MTKSGEKLLKLLPHIEEYQKYIESNYQFYSSRCEYKNDLGFTTGFEAGNKYVRIFHWYDSGSSLKQRSCHSFIDLNTGDIWKAASWKAPAKNFPRGNVIRKEYGTIRWTGC
jgi:hypothetical protein